LLTLFGCKIYLTEFVDIFFLIYNVSTLFVEIPFVAADIVDIICGKCLLAKNLLMCLGTYTFMTKQC